jgi:acyl-CoA synthetase (AMP-forming)/AMP-acid ligase II/aryl carrier-like protein
MQALEATFGVPVIESYGMTEAASQITSNPLPPRSRKPGCAGLPAGPELKILKEDGREAGAQETGEVLIRGENVITAYGDGSAPSSAFADGWLRTGDLGYLDEDGYLFITGRSRDLIDRGGLKVAPREVEEALLRLPGVRETAVFGVAHPRLGEDVAAVVVGDRPGSVNEAELRQQLFASLSSYKVPSRIREVDAIPLSPAGKRKRSGLAALLAPEDERPTGDGARGEQLAKRIAKVWTTVLGVDTVGVEDNFFALGGDSLQAGRVIARLRGEIGEEVSLRALLENPTPSGLAASLRQKDQPRAD